MRRSGCVSSALVLGATIVVAACGGSSQDTAASDQVFWDGLRVLGDETEYFAELDDMGDDADIAATGRFIDFQMSRTIRDPAVPEDVVSYGVASFETDQVVSDTSTPEVLPVEFLLPGTTEAEQRDAVERLRAELPEGELAVFLRAKSGEDEEGFYRLVNSTGLWVLDASADLQAPLVHEGEIPYESDVAGVTSVDQLLEEATTP